MDSLSDDCPESWPPGTVRIETLHATKAKDGIVLQPRPTDNINDPLNWGRWRKHLNFGLSCFYALMVFAFIGKLAYISV